MTKYHIYEEHFKLENSFPAKNVVSAVSAK